MNLKINGKPYQHKGDGCLKSLLEEYGADISAVVVMVNDVIVKQKDDFRLTENDCVEIFVVTGGG